MNDIRWIQRFRNFQRALSQLSRFVDSLPLNELEEQGLIQSFEYNHELACNTLKDLLAYQGVQGVLGSRDATRKAFKLGILGDDGQVWMDMIKSRNLTSHTYNEDVKNEISADIINKYYKAFLRLEEVLEKLSHEDE